MLQETNPRLLAYPNDDELYSTFFEAAQEWAHDNIKWIVNKIGEFSGAAKCEVKRMVLFDAAAGLSFKFDMQTGNDVMKGFVDAQPFLVKPGVKLLMATYHASTFDMFIAKMKEKPENIELTKNTLTKIFTLFFQKLGVKYVVNETPEHIAALVTAVFN